MNLLKDIKAANPQLTWTHEPQWRAAADGIRVHVPARVDYFQDPTGKMSADNAPYLSCAWQGDFTARAHVRHAFQHTYDAGALMVRQDAIHWAKLCFEATDFGTHAVVSVVTGKKSDDANGVDVSTSDVWLQVVRRGDLFGMHYSLDGVRWRMVRYFSLEMPREVQVGLVAQCPVGPGAVIDWLSFEINPETPANMRAGV